MGHKDKVRVCINMDSGGDYEIVVIYKERPSNPDSIVAIAKKAKGVNDADFDGPDTLNVQIGRYYHGKHDLPKVDKLDRSLMHELGVELKKGAKIEEDLSE